MDVLAGETDVPVGELETEPTLPPLPSENDLGEAVRLLADAERPVIWAGGGVLRSGAWEELRAIAERLGAPVVSTYMGKGAFPEDHSLAVGTASDEPAVQELLCGADAILAVGTELGAETTSHYALELRGRLVHVDRSAADWGDSEALGLVGVARGVLRRGLEGIPRPRQDRTEGGRALADSVAARRADRRARASLVRNVREGAPRDRSLLGHDDPAYWRRRTSRYEPRSLLYPSDRERSVTRGRGARRRSPCGPAVWAWSATGAQLTASGRGSRPRAIRARREAAPRRHGATGSCGSTSADQFGEEFSVDSGGAGSARRSRAFGVPSSRFEPDGIGAPRSGAGRDGPAVGTCPRFRSCGPVTDWNSCRGS